MVVVAYDMARELPRTLRSLAPAYQQGLDGLDYELIVIDNGSPQPLEPSIPALDVPLRYRYLADAAPSPGRAVNIGISMARAEFVGLIIDGARIASPGLLAHAMAGLRLGERCVVAAPGYHLGADRHMNSPASGYDRVAEDRLLEEIDWLSDGYRLLSASTLAASSARGWFGPMGETNSLFMPRAIWGELGGIDEAFALPGGGLSNHDLFRRACDLPGTELIILLGEGTFHQIHGGAATAGRLGWDEMHAEYQSLRGEDFCPPDRQRSYLGRIPSEALAHLETSVAWLARQTRSR